VFFRARENFDGNTFFGCPPKNAWDFFYRLGSGYFATVIDRKDHEDSEKVSFEKFGLVEVFEIRLKKIYLAFFRALLSSLSVGKFKNLVGNTLLCLLSLKYFVSRVEVSAFLRKGTF
jgi:hypothetical protein